MNPLSSGNPAELNTAIANTVRIQASLARCHQIGNLTRLAAVVHVADQQEQQSSRDAVIDLLDDAPRDAIKVQGENTQRAKAQ